MIVPPPSGVGTASRCSNTGQPTAPTRVDLQMCSRISLVRQCEQSLREALFRVWGPHGGPIFALRVTQSSRESVPWIWNDQVGDTNRLTTRRVDLIVYVTGLLPEPPRSIFRAYNSSLFTRAEHTSEGLHAFLRPTRRCLSIPRHTRHCTMVGHQLIHQAVPLSRHRSRITVTPSSSL